jgi:hypothetical protein
VAACGQLGFWSVGRLGDERPPAALFNHHRSGSSLSPCRLALLPPQRTATTARRPPISHRAGGGIGGGGGDGGGYFFLLIGIAHLRSKIWGGGRWPPPYQKY